MRKEHTTSKVYLIPSPISSSQKEYSKACVEAIDLCSVFFVEHTSSAVAFCKMIIPQFNPATKEWIAIHKREEEVLPLFREALQEGKHIGMMSDAGCPCIADPGFLLVAQAHLMGAEIIPIVGASSLLLALMASGLNAQRFSFHGYLPIAEGDRKKTIRQLEQISLRHSSTQICIETPYRNQTLFHAFLEHLSGDTKLSIASSLLSANQQINTMTVSEWKGKNWVIGKVETVFLFQAG